MPDRLVSLDDVFSLATVSDPQWSPDGRSIACVVARPDLKANRERGAIWLVASTGGAPARQLTAGAFADRMPRFSPDGRTLAFVSNRSGTDRVWTIPVDGGEASPLLDDEAQKAVGPVATDDFYSALEWRPDGKALAFVAQLPPPPPPDADDVDQTDAKVVGRIDGEGYGEIQRLHVWQATWPEREVRQLTSGDYHHGDFRWLPDSRRLVLVSNRSGDEEAVRSNVSKDYNLYSLDVESGEMVCLTANPGPDWAPRPSPDGSRIAYLSSPRKGSHADTPVLGFLPSDGGQAQVLLGQDGPFLERPTSACWSPDGRALYVAAGVGAATRVTALVAYAGEGATALIDGGVVATTPVVSPDGSRIACVLQGTDRPPEIAVVPADGGEPSVVTEFNGALAGVLLGRTDVHRWEAADGVAVEGVVVLPPGHRDGERHPLLVVPHGGPHSRSTLAFNVEWQYWAARGYVVFAPNFRGSTGYGQAFSDLDRGDFGGGDWADVISGVEALVSAGLVDVGWAAIMGGSYGGYMTVWAIGHTSLFKAAVAIEAVVDLTSMYGQTDIPSWVEWEVGLPWYSRDKLVERSPITYATRITTPTLIVHGDADQRVPLPQSQQLFRALKGLGVECEMVRYPREGHGIKEPRHRRDLLRRIGGWLDRHLGT